MKKTNFPKKSGKQAAAENKALEAKFEAGMKDAMKKTNGKAPAGDAKVTIAKKPAEPVRKTTKVMTIIEKIKVENKDQLAVIFTRIESDGATGKYGVMYDRICHPDLRNAIQDMNIHLALMCGYLSTKQIKSLDKYEPEQLKPFHISGISIKHDEGITITGHRINEQKKAVILNTPYALFSEDDKSRYRWMDDLQVTLAIIIDEVKQYIDGSKQGVEQLKLELPEPATADQS